ncbi:NUDIX domain-containing protein [Helicobacter sp. 11S02596-1]|uniref:NUDIX domain-containing protein n=1 Tax=Helicobacter sp. 11S02596-1 TaxID=1476194 RepID=UPI000BA6B609|nr:NUDIX domain-containing protein [Helicobacter sp. 11S02596-1]PAF44297.1 NUDIX hydrolase [Helicobacter sp. 11S02596-1]
MKYFAQPTSKVDFDSIRYIECLNSAYIKPKRMVYSENGKEKSWDIIASHDSVSILLYHRDFDSFVIVRQFRPAVYFQNGEGYTYELCAGLVDKPGKSLEEIASEEVLEECGYEVLPSALKKIAVFYSSTGISGSKQTIFFTTITEKNKRTQGGGIDEECIDVLFLPAQKAKDFIEDDSLAKTSGLCYAIRWYLDNFYDKEPAC